MTALASVAVNNGKLVRISNAVFAPPVRLPPRQGQEKWRSPNYDHEK
jgi:hypothetical protein